MIHVPFLRRLYLIAAAAALGTGLMLATRSLPPEGGADPVSLPTGAPSSPAPILWLGAWEGRLAAFQEGAAAPVEVYDVFLAALPEADRQALLDRIPVRDEEELETLLQDLSP